MSLSVTPCSDRDLWDATVDRLGGHPQQLWGWGRTKADHGWSADRVLIAEDGVVIAAAQLVLKKLPVPLRSLAYVPRGPVTAEGRGVEVLGALAGYVRAAHRSVALSIEPDWDAGSDVVRSLAAAGWRQSDNTILIGRTLILDLSRSEDDLLADMSKKHRQYIRKSGREGLEVRRVQRSELADCLAVYRVTADRAGFGIHEDSYYLDIFDHLGDASPVYAAFQGADVVAFLWLSASASTSFELYGGMTDEGERLRANYALKWFAIQEMKGRGVVRYDFNGLLNDGVSKFKMGWAKHEDQLAGTWDLPLSRFYPVFSRALPLAKRGMQVARRQGARGVGLLRRVRRG
ncbi:peptidoglycan bridge formation glycyltransferase FemA/FemB family protein [Arthrobacter agilis]|uniref:lipid II:glycine glycyltransferase FemX n=1 Tax=Arthrobacter agilis TaxID=37921 RepID=UPI000B356F65|nr:peptidoglycan bridge formation glycyltransferase FemA/FemB family protein [Arthrobacter agilis]OUM40524.1 methicillin resistance protein [Arthrobacter agilis]PPB45137.1 peptidoglycan bridge formation glycyltransferase FemA/FemB family protein [Arthrobacter agilis]TPV27837.1 peptidoglycan bridge formation glycyltransferase FemA/FemB family protein [Arthrobacter agilis]VDR31499.1 Lipid II:glycine glycyltransferase [Arthrobacter agilis]